MLDVERADTVPVRRIAVEQPHESKTYEITATARGITNQGRSGGGRFEHEAQTDDCVATAAQGGAGERRWIASRTALDSYAAARAEAAYSSERRALRLSVHIGGSMACDAAAFIREAQRRAHPPTGGGRIAARRLAVRPTRGRARRAAYPRPSESSQKCRAADARCIDPHACTRHH